MTKFKKIEIINSGSFKEELCENSLNIVKFYKDGYPHCATLDHAIYEKINANKKYHGYQLKFLDVGVIEENMKLFSEYEVSSIPTTMFFIHENKNFKILKKVIGADSDLILKEFDECLKICK